MVVLSMPWTLHVLLEPEETSKWKLPLLCVGRSLDFVLRLISQGNVPSPKAHRETLSVTGLALMHLTIHEQVV